jgi:tungstate transport system substrate-binding protein
MIRIIALLASIFVIGTAQADERFITLASSIEPEASGLLDYLLPIFRASTGVTVHVIAVGTGRALAMGERGEADALLVHDPIGEAKFIAHGFGIDLCPVMFDDFVIVGPGTDPAGTWSGAFRSVVLGMRGNVRTKCAGNKTHARETCEK